MIFSPGANVSEVQLRQRFQELLKKKQPEIKSPILNGRDGSNSFEIKWRDGRRQKLLIQQNSLAGTQTHKFR